MPTNSMTVEEVRVYAGVSNLYVWLGRSFRGKYHYRFRISLRGISRARRFFEKLRASGYCAFWDFLFYVLDNLEKEVRSRG